VGGNGGQPLPDRGQAATSPPVPTSRRRDKAQIRSVEARAGERRAAGTGIA